MCDTLECVLGSECPAEARRFLVEVLLPRFEETPLFLELLSRTLTYNHDQRLLPHWATLFDEHRHHYYKTYVDSLGMSAGCESLVVVSRYQWEGQRSPRKFEFGLELCAEATAAMAARFPHFAALSRAMSEFAKHVATHHPQRRVLVCEEEVRSGPRTRMLS